MKKLWLIFSQVVTVVLAIFFVISAIQPNWLKFSLRELRGGTMTEAVGISRLANAHTEDLRSAAKSASPAVVSIITNPEDNKGEGSLQNRLDPNKSLDLEDDEFSDIGSGVIMSKDGYILTNAHVVEGANIIEVTLSDGRSTHAKVIGVDSDTDLAVLKIDVPDLPAITLGDSDALQVGDSVLAIGNPFSVGQTVTSGIVSALNRNQLGLSTFENFIQTDAAINPGNSGGALVDIHGHLIGINTAIYTRSGGYMGIGFATPSNTAKHVLTSIIQNGYVARGWIGVALADLTPAMANSMGLSKGGAVVQSVLEKSPAALAGLTSGDVIVAVAGKTVYSVQELMDTVSRLQPGTATTLEYLRQGRQRANVTITPIQRPASKKR